MDGLLVDTERLWTIAQEELARRLGGVLTVEIKTALLGRGADSALQLLLSMLGAPPSAYDEAVRFLSVRTVELFGAPGAVVPRPGALELVRAVAAEGIPMALVSSSPRVLLDRVLNVVGRGWFDVSVPGDEVRRCKPHPEPYVTAARMLAVEPRDCVVLEDSDSGARAAVDAGCVTVLVPSAGVTATVPVAAVVESLHLLSVSSLRELFPAFPAVAAADPVLRVDLDTPTASEPP